MIIRHERYNALITQADWLASSTVPGDFTSETTPSNDRFRFDSITESIHLNSTTNKTHYFQFITDFLKIGDIIEVEAEFANVTGENPGKILIIDRVGKTQVTRISSDNTENNFKKIKYRHVITKDDSYDVLIGSQSGETANIKMRNFRIKTYSSFPDNRKYSETQNTKKVMIEGNASYSNKFIVRNDFASDQVTLTIYPAYILITWANPFVGSKRPIYVSSLDASSRKFIARLSTPTVNSVIVQFHSLTTGDLIQINDLDLSGSVNVSVIGTV